MSQSGHKDLRFDGENKQYGYDARWAPIVKDSGCLTYFISGRVGHCVMLPVWRWIGKNILRLE